MTSEGKTRYFIIKTLERRKNIMNITMQKIAWNLFINIYK